MEVTPSPEGYRRPIPDAGASGATPGSRPIKPTSSTHDWFYGYSMGLRSGRAARADSYCSMLHGRCFSC